MRICFYANLSQHQNWREMFEKIEFYRVDIQLLRSLGHEVILAGRPKDIDLKADLYYCWWWGHAPYALAAGIFRRRPVVVTGAFDYATCRKELPGICYLDSPWWKRLALNFVLRFATCNFFISKYEFEEVTKNLIVKHPILAPLAVDTGFYFPGGDWARSNYFFAITWLSKTNIIRKGLMSSLRAFALVANESSNLRFIIAGKHGDALPDVLDLCRELKIQDKVQFVGMISDEEKRRYYRECIAYFQPTLYEGFGHAIAEAVACGCPVVTSPNGAVIEVVGPYGHYADSSDAQALASALRLVLDAPLSAAQNNEQFQWIEKHFSLSARRSKLDQIIRSCVENTFTTA